MPEWIYVTWQNDQEHNRPSGNSKWLNPSPATALSGKRPHSESPCKGVPLQCETWKLSTQPNYFSIAIPCNSTGSATKTKWQPSSEWKKTVALCTVSPCKHGSIRRSWRVLHFTLSTRTRRGYCHGHSLHRATTVLTYSLATAATLSRRCFSYENWKALVSTHLLLPDASLGAHQV